MAWIDIVSPDEADDELRRLYGRMVDRAGNVDRILQIHSLSPSALANHFALYRDAMRGPSPLSRTQREMIGVVVSAVNECHY